MKAFLIFVFSMLCFALGVYTIWNSGKKSADLWYAQHPCVRLSDLIEPHPNKNIVMVIGDPTGRALSTFDSFQYEIPKEQDKSIGNYSVGRIYIVSNQDPYARRRPKDHLEIELRKKYDDQNEQLIQLGCYEQSCDFSTMPTPKLELKSGDTVEAKILTPHGVSFVTVSLELIQ